MVPSNFYPLRSMSMFTHNLNEKKKTMTLNTKSSLTLNFPPAVLLSENYTPQMHRRDLTRRFKNVTVLLDWRPEVHIFLENKPQKRVYTYMRVYDDSLGRSVVCVGHPSYIHTILTSPGVALSVLVLVLVGNLRRNILIYSNVYNWMDGATNKRILTSGLNIYQHVGPREVGL